MRLATNELSITTSMQRAFRVVYEQAVRLSAYRICRSPRSYNIAVQAQAERHERLAPADRNFAL